MMRYDPQRKENLGERFHQSANACGSAPAMTSISIKETPALNALKVLRGAPISMGRGEIPVELRPAAVRFLPLSFSTIRK